MNGPARIAKALEILEAEMEYGLPWGGQVTAGLGLMGHAWAMNAEETIWVSGNCNFRAVDGADEPSLIQIRRRPAQEGWGVPEERWQPAPLDA